MEWELLPERVGLCRLPQRATHLRLSGQKFRGWPAIVIQVAHLSVFKELDCSYFHRSRARSEGPSPYSQHDVWSQAFRSLMSLRHRICICSHNVTIRARCWHLSTALFLHLIYTLSCPGLGITVHSWEPRTCLSKQDVPVVEPVLLHKRVHLRCPDSMALWDVQVTEIFQGLGGHPQMLEPRLVISPIRTLHVWHTNYKKSTIE